MTHDLVHEVHQAIRAAAPRTQPQPERRFHKHDEYICYGLTTPAFRRVIKELRPRLLEPPLPQRLALASKLLRMHIGELGHTGIHVVALSVDELTPRHYQDLDGLLDDFRSWSHVDHLCGEVMQPLLHHYRRRTLALLKRWNYSPVRWKRRASVVTFTRKVGESGGFTEEALRLCDHLIWDPEDIVQKGVGWALKDILRGAPRRVLPYIKDLRRRGVPSTITLYAIRDLKGPERSAVLRVKKR